MVLHFFTIIEKQSLLYFTFFCSIMEAFFTEPVQNLSKKGSLSDINVVV